MSKLQRSFYSLLTVVSTLIWSELCAQQSDTVVLDLAPSSKIVFTLGDRTELAQIKEYDYQAIFDDIFLQIEGNAVDTTFVTPEPYDLNHSQDDWYNDDKEFWEPRKEHENHDFPQSRFVTNFDFGINNYFFNDPFIANKDQLEIRPWGSWYFAAQFQRHFWFSKNFHLELGAGLSNYAFKFQDDATLLIKTEDEILFTQDTRDIPFIKSTFQISHVNVSFVPVFSTGLRPRHADCNHWHQSRLRLGIGAFAGYRLWSSAKQRFILDGEKVNDKNRDSFHLHTLRYGIRFQVGIESTDFFFNYDLNSLFNDGKGPKLNAYSFGLIF